MDRLQSKIGGRLLALYRLIICRLLDLTAILYTGAINNMITRHLANNVQILFGRRF